MLRNFINCTGSSCNLIPLAALLALSTAGCVCPPCEARSAVGGNDAAGTSDAAGAAGDGAGAATPTGNRYVIWDGEGTGEAAKGWADCDKKPGCKGNLAPEPGAGVDGSTGLKLHGEGPGWIGMGWNWIGWWPEDGGIDVSGYKMLRFAVRVKADSPEQAPDLSSLNVSLRCSKGKKDSAAVTLKNYAPDVLDGEWHQIAIPLMEFAKDEFDPQTAWELNLGTWSESPKKFDIYIDEIAIEK